MRPVNPLPQQIHLESKTIERVLVQEFAPKQLLEGDPNRVLLQADGIIVLMNRREELRRRRECLRATKPLGQQ